MGAMNVLVLGATGGTGRQVVAQALQKGHTVTALVRDPARLEVAGQHLRVRTGDVRDGNALGEAMRGQDVVISALGVGKSFKPAALIVESTEHIVRAMESQGVRRLVVTSAFGVGDTYRDTPFVPRLFIRLLLKDIYRDKHAGEEIIRPSGLDWTIVYPTGLTDDPPSGQYRVGERLTLRGFPKISRTDVADFLVQQIEDTRYVRKGVLISS
jgi:putative NADH-flavin reductase